MRLIMANKGVLTKHWKKLEHIVVDHPSQYHIVLLDQRAPLFNGNASNIKGLGNGPTRPARPVAL